MSRLAEVEIELRDTAKRDALVRALEFGIVGALESQGIEMLGFSFKYDAFNSLMTIRAVVGGVKSVAFVGSDTVINCILKAQSEAQRDGLVWGKCKFQ